MIFSYLPRFQVWPLWKRKLAILAAIFVYLSSFAVLYPLLGSIAVVPCFVPVAITAWMMGHQAGFFAGILAVLLNIMLVNLMGEAGVHSVLVRGAPSAFALVLLGPLAGWVSEVIQQLQTEIHARQEAEQRHLALAEEQGRASMLERFVTDIAHDFRTPLTTMKLNVYLLKRKQNDPNAVGECANILTTQVDHMSRALDDMTLILRLESNADYLSCQHLVINEMVQGVVDAQKQAANQKDQQLSFIPGASLPLVLVDQSLLARAIQNLVVNAIVYTPTGGSITIRTYSTATSVAIEVQDSGIGIAADVEPHIFEHFFRADSARSTHTGGVGLGLSIVQKVVEAHQGRIEVESTPEEGSTFRVLLPQSALHQLT